jgi:hypothetical protein
MKIRSSRLPGKSGSLCQFTQVKTAKDGSRREYPSIEGDRDPLNIFHWYYHYTYKQKSIQGKFVTHTKTVPRSKVPTVSDLIAQNTSVTGILEYLQSSG